MLESPKPRRIRSIVLLRASALLAVLVGVACCVSPAGAASNTDDDEHPLERAALTKPQLVLEQIERILPAAQARQDNRELALLYLAKSNACRVVANWPCQWAAGTEARRWSVAVGDKRLELRSLIAEARGVISLGHFSEGQDLLGLAESRLASLDAPELAAEVYLAYSSLAFQLGKHSLAREYANRGLAKLAPEQARGTRIRLLRNRARAEAQLELLAVAEQSLAEGMRLAAAVSDPKLEAELHLEAARLAGRRNDPETQILHSQRLLDLSVTLANSQLYGLGEEMLGTAAFSQGKPKEAVEHLERAMEYFARMNLARDELRVLRELIRGLPDDSQVVPYVRRLTELDVLDESLYRATAGDDFDRRVEYVTQDETLLRMREESLAREQQARMLKMGGLGLILLLAMLGVFLVLQRRSGRKLADSLDVRRRVLLHTGHELRNAIGGVLGLSDLLLKRPLENSSRMTVQALHHAASSINNLASDLLDRGRLDSGKLALDVRPASLMKLVTTVREVHAVRARERA